MTYNTPELLLVGAAQNLVLGGVAEDKILFDQNADTPDAPVYSEGSLSPDHDGW